MFTKNITSILLVMIALFFSFPSRGWSTLYESGDRTYEVTAYTFLETANLESVKGNYDAARKAYFEAEKLFRREQNSLGLAKVLLGVGNTESIGGDLDAARKAYMEAEKLFRNKQEWLDLARVLLGIGNMERISGNLDAAKKIYIDAEKLFRQKPYWPGVAKVLHGLAEVESRLGNSEKSLEIYNELAKIQDRINDQYKQFEIVNVSEEHSSILPDDTVESDIACNLSDIFTGKITIVIFISVISALVAIIIYLKPLRRFKK
ncbi:MAG: tetratricopeptide repeat protein [Candidatus Electrothrix aestuarii]|uniref:Tetratricopeptide repeat protein n=1 Tax=Candidatus Electrothrix aestuarii TaxID=3062594 RepID=A0AAU8LZF4_9BACT|nr:tetratricopeptide repeat protein [Candidatus Electrothrix aestuarii]